MCIRDRAKARVTQEVAMERVAKANQAHHLAEERVRKKARQAERSQKEGGKERLLKKRTSRTRGCFILRHCCPTEGESCAEPKQRERRDTWGEEHEQTGSQEFKCFARAQEIYDQCESVLPVVARFGITGRTFMFPPDSSKHVEMPVLPRIPAA
eukprot:TRINITY_DN13703_c0_g1_i2.p1 TRINITY_DN13703_c0_g1~~TRINITY_DN13703_c0_g1_i2.p1  ORF type:complete len:154 (+),score=34.64 TRINITY_DN13703_c0_g1_i2:113-574(+)